MLPEKDSFIHMHKNTNPKAFKHSQCVDDESLDNECYGLDQSSRIIAENSSVIKGCTPNMFIDNSFTY